MPRFAPIAGLRAFARAEKGAMAVEFAIIALPFLILLFGIIELAMVFLATTTLQNATEMASRKIRTGEFQTSGATAKTDFAALVCQNMNWLAASCPSKLTVAVQTFSNFTTAAGAPPPPSSTFNPNTATCWSTGDAGDIVLVRTYYQWNLFTPMLNHALANMNGSTTKRLITSVSTFRNEPFSDNNPVGARC
jgi:Flp pilus assembly protein TadG